MAKRGAPGAKIFNDAEVMVEVLNKDPITKHWTHKEFVNELKF